jgi:hypothetical protein
MRLATPQAQADKPSWHGVVFPAGQPRASRAQAGAAECRHRVQNLLISGRIRREEGLAVQDLSVLTPPLLMCAVVVIAVVAFVRHEMGKKRSGDDSRESEDFPATPPISGPAGDDEAGVPGPVHRSRDT